MSQKTHDTKMIYSVFFFFIDKVLYLSYSYWWYFQIWFFKLIHMVWILQCSIGQRHLLNLWCKELFSMISLLCILHYTHVVIENCVEFGSLQTIRSWHIIGRLGGCNAMNMQVSFSLLQLIQNFHSPFPFLWNSKHGCL